MNCVCFQILYALLSVKSAILVLPKRIHAKVRKGGLFSAPSSACGLAGNVLALGLDDLTLWFAELCDHGKRFSLFLFFANVFCRPSDSLFETVKMTSISSQMAKSTTLNCLILFVLAATPSSWCWSRLKLRRLNGPSNHTDTWR